MQLSSVVRVAFRALIRSTSRSALAILGMVIGASAVVTMAALGSGAKAAIEHDIAGLDATQLTVTALMPRSLWRGGRSMRLPPGDGLSVGDYVAIRSSVPNIEKLSLQAYPAIPQLEGNGSGSDALIYGVDEDGLDVIGRTLSRGNYFSRMDVLGAALVCVISEYLSERLFGKNGELGNVIRIDDVPFRVIGIVKDNQSFAHVAQPDVGDVSVYVPYTAILNRINRMAQISIVMKGRNPSSLSGIQERVRDLLESRRGKRRAEFHFSNIEEATRLYKNGSETMSLLLGSIGAVSLIVGGIGIMNIMLVGVMERTREIGIRVAIGTRRRQVLGQFLTESAALSLVGGALGVLIGIVAAKVLTYLNGWPTQITLSSVAAAVVMSTVVGLISGMVPARRAAALLPVVALKTE